MKLTSIDLYSNNQRVASLSYRDPGSRNPYIAQNITGLDADEIVPKFYGDANNGIDKFYNLSLNKRDVVMLISLNPQFSQGSTYSELRDDLYRMISSSRTGKIQLRFMRGVTTIAAITGFITKFENNLFAKTPQVQLTVSCEDPEIRSLAPIGVDPLLIGTSTTIVDNKSTTPHGVTFDLTFDANATAFTIKDAVDPTWTFTIIPGLIAGLIGFRTDDILFYSNEESLKTLYIKRGLNTYNVIDKIESGSTWPILFPGANDFEFVLSGPFTWNNFSYYTTYWGI